MQSMEVIRIFNLFCKQRKTLDNANIDNIKQKTYSTVLNDKDTNAVFKCA